MFTAEFDGKAYIELRTMAGRVMSESSVALALCQDGSSAATSCPLLRGAPPPTSCSAPGPRSATSLASACRCQCCCAALGSRTSTAHRTLERL